MSKARFRQIMAWVLVLVIAFPNGMVFAEEITYTLTVGIPDNPPSAFSASNDVTVEIYEAVDSADSLEVFSVDDSGNATIPEVYVGKYAKAVSETFFNNSDRVLIELSEEVITSQVDLTQASISGAIIKDPSNEVYTGDGEVLYGPSEDSTDNFVPMYDGEYYINNLEAGTYFLRNTGFDVEVMDSGNSTPESVTVPGDLSPQVKDITIYETDFAFDVTQFSGPYLDVDFYVSGLDTILNSTGHIMKGKINSGTEGYVIIADKPYQFVQDHAVIIDNGTPVRLDGVNVDLNNRPEVEMVIPNIGGAVTYDDGPVSGEILVEVFFNDALVNANLSENSNYQTYLSQAGTYTVEVSAFAGGEYRTSSMDVIYDGSNPIVQDFSLNETPVDDGVLLTVNVVDNNESSEADFEYNFQSDQNDPVTERTGEVIEIISADPGDYRMRVNMNSGSADNLGANFVDFTVLPDGTISDGEHFVTELDLPVYNAVNLGKAVDYNGDSLGHLHVHINDGSNSYFDFYSMNDGEINVILPEGSFEFHIDGQSSDLVEPWIMQFDIDGSGNLTKGYDSITFGQVVATGLVKLNDTDFADDNQLEIKVYEQGNTSNKIREFKYEDGVYKVGNLVAGTTYSLMAMPYDDYYDAGYRDSDIVDFTVPSEPMDPLNSAPTLTFNVEEPQASIFTFNIMNGENPLNDFDYNFDAYNHNGGASHDLDTGIIEVFSIDPGTYEVFVNGIDEVKANSEVFQFKVVDENGTLVFKTMDDADLDMTDGEADSAADIDVALADITIKVTENGVDAAYKDVRFGIHGNDRWFGDYRTDVDGNVHLVNSHFPEGQFSVYIMADEPVRRVDPVFEKDSNGFDVPSALEINSPVVDLNVFYMDGETKTYVDAQVNITVGNFSWNFDTNSNEDAVLVEDGTYLLKGLGENVNGYDDSDELTVTVTDGVVDAGNVIEFELIEGVQETVLAEIDVQGLDSEEIQWADTFRTNDFGGEIDAYYGDGVLTIKSADDGTYKMLLDAYGTYPGHSKFLTVTVDGDNVTFADGDLDSFGNIVIYPASQDDSITVTDARTDKSYDLNATVEIIEVFDDNHHECIGNISAHDGQFNIAPQAYEGGNYILRYWGNDTFYNFEDSFEVVEGDTPENTAINGLNTNVAFTDRQLGVQVWYDEGNGLIHSTNDNGVEIKIGDNGYGFGLGHTFYFAGLPIGDTVKLKGWTNYSIDGFGPSAWADVVVEAGSANPLIKKLELQDISASSLAVFDLTGVSDQEINDIRIKVRHFQEDTHENMYMNNGKLIVESANDGRYAIILQHLDADYPGNSARIEVTVSTDGEGVQTLSVDDPDNDLNSEDEIVIWPATATINMVDQRTGNDLPNLDSHIEIRKVTNEEYGWSDYYVDFEAVNGQFHLAKQAFDSGKYTIISENNNGVFYAFDATFTSDGDGLEGTPADLIYTDVQFEAEIGYMDGENFVKLEEGNEFIIISDNFDLGYWRNGNFPVAGIESGKSVEIFGKNHSDQKPDGLGESQRITVTIDTDGNVEGDFVKQLILEDPLANAQTTIPVKAMFNDTFVFDSMDVRVSHRDNGMDSDIYFDQGQIIVNHASTGNYYIFVESNDSDFYGHSRLVEAYIDGSNVSFLDGADVDNGSILIHPATVTSSVNDVRTDKTWELHPSIELVRVDGDNQDWAGHFNPHDGVYQFAPTAFENSDYALRLWADNTVYPLYHFSADGTGFDGLVPSLDYTDRQLSVELGVLDGENVNKVTGHLDVRLREGDHSDGYGFNDTFYFAGLSPNKTVYISGSSHNEDTDNWQTEEKQITIDGDGDANSPDNMLVLYNPLDSAQAWFNVYGESNEELGFDVRVSNRSHDANMDVYEFDGKLLIQSANAGDYRVFLTSNDSSYIGHSKSIDMTVDEEGNVTINDMNGDYANDRITIYEADQTIPVSVELSEFDGYASIELMIINDGHEDWMGNIDVIKDSEGNLSFKLASGALDYGRYLMRVWANDTIYFTDPTFVMDETHGFSDGPPFIVLSERQFGINLEYVNGEGQAVQLMNDNEVEITFGDDNWGNFGFGKEFYFAGIDNDTTISIKGNSWSKPDGYTWSEWTDISIDSEGKVTGTTTMPMETLTLRSLSEAADMVVKLVTESGDSYTGDMSTVNYGDNIPYSVERDGEYIYYSDLVDGTYQLINYEFFGDNVMGTGFYEVIVENGLITNYGNPKEIVKTVAIETPDTQVIGKYYDQPDVTTNIATYTTNEEGYYAWPVLFGGLDSGHDAAYYRPDGEYLVRMVPYDTTYAMADPFVFTVVDGVSTNTEKETLIFNEAQITGHAYDYDGQALGGMNPDGSRVDNIRPIVFLYIDGDKQMGMATERISYANADGVFSFAGIPDGEHIVQSKIYEDEYMKYSKEYAITVSGGQLTSGDLVVSYELPQVKVNFATDSERWLKVFDSNGDEVNLDNMTEHKSDYEADEYYIKLGYLEPGDYEVIACEVVEGVYKESDPINVTIVEKGQTQEFTPAINEVNPILEVNFKDGENDYDGHMDLHFLSEMSSFKDYWLDSTYGLVDIDAGTYTFLFNSYNENEDGTATMMGHAPFDITVDGDGVVTYNGEVVTSIDLQITEEVADLEYRVLDAEGIQQEDYIYRIRNGDDEWPGGHGSHMSDDGITRVYYLPENTYSVLSTPLFKEGAGAPLLEFAVDANGDSTLSGLQTVQFEAIQVRGTITDIDGAGVGDLGSDGPIVVLVVDTPYGEDNLVRAYTYDDGHFTIGGLEAGVHTIYGRVYEQENVDEYLNTQEYTFDYDGTNEVVIEMVMADREIVLNMDPEIYETAIYKDASMVLEYGYEVNADDDKLEVGGLEAGDYLIRIKGSNDKILAEPLAVGVIRKTVQEFTPVFVDADYSALDAKIAEAGEAVNQPAYTAESRANLQLVIDDAVAVRAGIQAQSDLDQMTAELQTALDGLVFGYDKSALEAEIARGDLITDLSGITEVTATPFSEKLETAKGIRDAELVTQLEIDNATDELSAAIDALDVVEPEISASTQDPTKEDVTLTVTGPYTLMYAYGTSEEAPLDEAYLEFDGTLVIGENTVVYVKSVYGELSSGVVDFIVDYIDKEAPSLIMSETVMTVDIGQVFVEPGYMTLDNSGSTVDIAKDLSALELVDGKTTKLGDLTIIYTATDEAGNSTSKNVLVHVVDRVAPEASIEVAGSARTGEIKTVGTDILVTPTATDSVDQNVDTFTVEINGIAVTDDNSDGVYVLPLVAGDNYVYVEAEDASNNVGTANLVINRVMPTLSADETGLTNEDVVVSASLGTVTDLGTVVYTMDNISDATPATNATSLSVGVNDSTVTVVANVTGVTSADDDSPVSYTVTNIDKEAPADFTIDVLNTEATNDVVYVKIESEEDVKYSVNFDDESMTDLVNEEYTGVFTVSSNATIDAVATDAAGNTKSADQVIVSNIDKDAPVISDVKLLIADLDAGDLPVVKIGESLKVEFTSAEDNIAGYVKFNDEVIDLMTKDGTTYTIEIPVPASSSYNNRVVLWVEDAVGNATEMNVLTTELKIDVVAPVITLNGGDMIIEVKSTFEDPGATVFDDLDDLTVTGVSDVNTDTVGLYEVTYNKSDEAGNAAEQVTRSVEVVDTIKPVIETNLSDRTVARSALVFTASAEDNNILSTFVVTQNGQEVSGTNGSYDVTLDEGLNTFVLTATDSQNNVSFETYSVEFVRPASDKPSLLPSTEEPTNEAVEVYVEHDNAFAVEVEKDGLTYDFGGDKDNIVVTFDDNGSLRARVQQGSESEWSEWVEYSVTNIDKVAPAEPVAAASTTLQTNENVTVTLTGEGDLLYSFSEISGDTADKDLLVYEGSITLTQNATIYAKAIDAAGNDTIMSAGFVVENIDKEAPIGNIVYSTLSPTNDAVVATLQVNEDFNMVSGLRYEKFEANGTRVFEFEDLAGNTASVTATVENIDKVDPEITSSTYTVEGQVPTIVKGGDILDITANVGEESTVTVDFGTLIFDEAMTYDDGAVSGKIIVPSDYDGLVTVIIKAEDVAGNIATETVVADLVVDNTKPVIEAMMNPNVEMGDNDFVVSNMIIDIVTDGQKIFMGTDQNSITTEIQSPYAVDGAMADGEMHTLYFKAVDVAGNVSEVNASIDFKWDNTAPDAPVLASNILNMTVTNDDTVYMRGSAEAGYVTIDRVAGNISETAAYIETSKFFAGEPVNLFEGDNVFTVYVSDMAGNKSTGTIKTITLDSTAPIVSVTKPEDSNIITVESNEEASSVLATINGEVVDLTLAESNGSYVGTITASLEGENVVVIDVEDAAGNVGVGRLSFIYVPQNVRDEQQLSDGLTLNEGQFTADAELSVRTVETQPQDGMTFVGEPMDFDLNGEIEIATYILVDQYIGEGHPANTKMYFHSEDGNWYVLDGSLSDNVDYPYGHGDSYYNATDSSVSVTLGNADYADDGRTVTVDVEAGHLVAIMYHFSEYATQGDGTPPVITVESNVPDYVNTTTIDVDVELSEGSYVLVDGVRQGNIKDPGTHTITLSLNAEGLNSIELSADDGMDNIAEEARTIEVIRDTTNPVVSLADDSTVNNATYSIVVDATETNLDRVEVKKGETLLTTSTVEDFNYNVTLVEGENTYTVTAFDKAGNTPVSENITITLDTMGPTIDSSVNDGDVLASDLDIDVTLSDGTFTYVLNDGVSDVKTGTVNATTGNVAYAIPANSKSTYTLTIDAEDALGNASREVTTFVVDTSAPEITISSVNPLNSSDVTLTITVEPNDADTTIELWKDGNRITSPSPSGSNAEYTLTVSDDGVYEVVVDALNLGTSARKTSEFVIDQTAPVIQVSGVSEGGSYTTAKVITLSTDDGVTTPTATLKKDAGVAQVFNSGNTVSENGTYVLTVNATDAAGNVADQVVVNFTIDIQVVNPPNPGDDDDDDGGSGSSGGGYVPPTVDEEPKSEEKMLVTAKKEDLVFGETNIVMNIKQAGLPAAFEITVRELAEEDVEEMTEAIPMTVKVASKVYQFSGTEDEFKGKISISIPYDPDLVKDPKKLAVYVLDETSGKWIAQGGKVDFVNHTVTFKTKHFSYYTVLEGNKTFSDLTGYSWAVESIETLASRDIIGGYGDGDYRPGNSVKRAEFAKMITIALALTKEGETSFTDISGKWYEEVIETAASNGIMSGYNNKANPEALITREQMAVMIVNAYKNELDLETIDEMNSDFNDFDTVSSWAKNQVALANKLGIINGKGNNMFAPKANATRAEAAAMIYRLLDILEIF